MKYHSVNFLLSKPVLSPNAVVELPHVEKGWIALGRVAVDERRPALQLVPDVPVQSYPVLRLDVMQDLT